MLAESAVPAELGRADRTGRALAIDINLLDTHSGAL